MSKKKIDENKIMHRMPYRIVRIVISVLAGGFLAAFGIWILVMMIEGIVENVQKGKGFEAFFLLLLIGGLFLLFGGGFFLFMGLKDVYNWIMLSLTKRYGEDGYANIESFTYKTDTTTNSSMRLHYVDTRFSLKLTYTVKSEQKTFKTDYLFWQCELDYLKTLDSIKIRIYKNYVAVVEEFRYGIYKGELY